MSMPLSYTMSRSRVVPDMGTEAEEILVPTFEIAANPTISIAEVKARRFRLIDPIFRREEMELEEEHLNNYLVMMEWLKIERIRESIPRYSIPWLEVE